ncbi:4Fe-4S dicluster domain-containing protein [Campylobacter geochelonis]|uniref:4Fe-4S dicluster domain-containing protein n=1 Tax=Campylobacter geochelonis TaxID=1780362 RepID=UPI0007707C40|nr:4Fe-4S dicluster domain-containing protein [Campylobacter geochelonis]CZE49849.1 iron-sulfur cluster-binding domain-containing protein [Campylobacter geochelonis]
MKEFVFIKTPDIDAVLPDDIDVLDSVNSAEYLVSNSKDAKAQVYAPEINFYLKNSQDSVLEKAKMAELLYEARAHTFDRAVDMDYQKEVGKNVIIISDDEKTTLASKLSDEGYKVISLSHAEVKFLYGEIGELYVTVLRENDEFEVISDFVLVNGIKEYMLRQSGTAEIANLKDDEILAFLNTRSPVYRYKSAITYDQSICQYHERRSEHCAKCVEICPTVAILKDDENKHLVFSHIDCNECGGCVSVCPSGAIDYAKMPRGAFIDVAKMYKGKKIIITPRIMDLEDFDIILPEGFLPFGVEGEKFLSQVHLLTLLQESGASLIFYSDIISAGVRESIELINQIYKAKFNEVAIEIATDEIELRKAIKNAKFIQGSQYSMSEYALAKREIFAKRVKYLVGDENLGVSKSGEWIRYGKVEINQDACTLCLSCVGACNVSALVADEKDNSIKFNASLCTTCGYCEVSCAEDGAIALTRGELRLEPSYFEYQTLAKDSLFACIECGKEFATTKAVMKIAQLMTPKFGDDSYKIKTLYCCADCKAKIMIKKQMEDAAKIYEDGK